MKTLALLSQKGGSGKSTLAVHLAVIAQAAGRRTVMARPCAGHDGKACYRALWQCLRRRC